MQDAFPPFPPFFPLPFILPGMQPSNGKRPEVTSPRKGVAQPASGRTAPSGGGGRVRVAPAKTIGADQVARTADDAELVGFLEGIARQDQSALAKFYDATVSRVYSVALRIVRMADMAEEVTADVYMQVWRDASRYDVARGRVLGWLLVIARSRALDLVRRQDEAFSHPEPHELVDEPEAQRSNPQDLLLCSESNAALHSALGMLTPLQRQLLSLAFFKGFSHSEIVDHTGIALGSVKTHIRRALGVLRDTLGDNFGDNFNAHF
jgi:RNA polymerase sigma factor (sigma-70 family)